MRQCDCGRFYFKNKISIAVNRQVHALDRAITSTGVPGVLETVPAYRTLRIYYDPEVISFAQIRGRLAALDRLSVDDRGEGESIMELPVLHGGEVEPESDVANDGWDGLEPRRT